MASKKGGWKSGAPDGQDINAALRAFKDDLGLTARVMWYFEDEYTLKVIVEAYREINGERLGVSRRVDTWQQGSVPVLTRVLQCLYYVYHDCEGKAYQKP